MKIGAQLYTVRDACQTLDGFADTLARVADMGFSTVQISGTCDYEGDWLAEQLKKNGLRCDLTHIELPEITDTTDALVEKHNTFSCPCIGIGYMPHEFRGSVRRIRSGSGNPQTVRQNPLRPLQGYGNPSGRGEAVLPCGCRCTGL